MPRIINIIRRPLVQVPFSCHEQIENKPPFVVNFRYFVTGICILCLLNPPALLEVAMCQRLNGEGGGERARERRGRYLNDV